MMLGAAFKCPALKCCHLADDRKLGQARETLECDWERRQVVQQNVTPVLVNTGEPPP